MEIQKKVKILQLGSYHMHMGQPSSLYVVCIYIKDNMLIREANIQWNKFMIPSI